MVKNLSTRFSIIGRGLGCHGGSSAIEKSAYITRTKLKSEYDGQTYFPKYSEDLVHTEISLPENAPDEFLDSATLWNSVEMKETGKNAQLARSLKFSLPNEWSYDLATEVVRDIIKKNFVDAGMCAEWAIHDSENEKTHQRNLHVHVMLTMRPLDEKGEWGQKQRKVYILDKNGKKIKNKNGKGYKCKTEDCTGWNKRENARKWRENIVATINETNERLGLTDDVWEHRSFKEQGLDLIPTIHLGEKATAMERAGIMTDKGNYNREVSRLNQIYLQATSAYNIAKQKVAEIKKSIAENDVTNEVIDMIRSVFKKKGAMDIPVVKGRYISQVYNRQQLTSADYLEQFTRKKKINTFKDLDNFIVINTKEEQERRAKRNEYWTKRKNLSEMSSIYAELAPYREIHRESISLKGKAKEKYDNAHARDLQFYEAKMYRLRKLLGDEKITPKKWKADIADIDAKLHEGEDEYNSLVADIAVAEVIDWNKQNLERERSNEERAKEQVRNKSKSKNRQNLE